MLSDKYKTNQLISILESLSSKKSTGVLTLKTDLKSWQYQRSCHLILRNGNFIFGDREIPDAKQICQALGDKINPNLIDAALLVVEQRINNVKSYQEYVNLLVKMKVFTWNDVKDFILQKIVSNLEIFVSHSGESQWKTINDFDLFSGKNQESLCWSDVMGKLNQRQQKWTNLMPEIPKMDAIPLVNPRQLQKIDNVQVKKHLTSQVDGKSNLLDIADKMGKDPYKIAKTYHKWVSSGWVTFKIEGNSQDLPIVLSLDDSLIVQVAIKRSLEETCHVILTDKATDAIKILNQQTVNLLLLDLTMPDVDGLKFCQTIRKKPKFKNLPIVMVTGRDGLVNKAKGHLAGANKYLTKPFEPQELREIVLQYIKTPKE